jgi:hypothetical protein
MTTITNQLPLSTHWRLVEGSRKGLPSLRHPSFATVSAAIFQKAGYQPFWQRARSVADLLLHDEAPPHDLLCKIADLLRRDAARPRLRMGLLPIDAT